MTMSMLTVWFYDPASESVTGANFVNKIVAGLYPPFCHTELQFPSGEACSIVMHGTVRLRQRTYDTDFYTPLVLRAPAHAVETARQLAHGHVQRRTAFGVSAGCTFCSKLVAELLLESGIVSRQSIPEPHLISPSTLFFCLKQLTGVVEHPPIAPPVSARTTPISFVTELSAAHQLKFIRP
jgi:hypothetical protein